MNNLLFKTALKWSLVSFGIGIVLSLPALFMGLEGGATFSIVTSVLSMLVSIAVFVIACLDYSKKRNHLASTGDMFGLVATMFGIMTVLSLLWGFIYMKFLYDPAEIETIPGMDSGAMYMMTFGITIIFTLIAAIAGLQIAGVWRTFQKAGKEGWECIVPIYNYMVMSEIGKNPSWWGILVLIPLVNIVFIILILHGVSRAFGKDGGWTVGLFLLGFIFWPLLAWGGAKYLHGDFESAPGTDVADHLVD